MRASAGERPLCVAEKLTLNNVFWQSCTVNSDHLPFQTRQRMYPFRELFLPGTRFSFYQYRDIEGCYQRHSINNLFHLSCTRGLKRRGDFSYFSVEGDYLFVEESVFE